MLAKEFNTRQKIGQSLQDEILDSRENSKEILGLIIIYHIYTG